LEKLIPRFTTALLLITASICRILPVIPDFTSVTVTFRTVWRQIMNPAKPAETGHFRPIEREE